MAPASPAAVRTSASLIVAAPIANPKQGESNYRLLMMKRNAKSSFVNAHVFPGGVVDKSDNIQLWRPLIQVAGKDDDLTHKICAVRETFEESGLLLTHPPAHTVLTEAETESWRHKVHADASQFKVLCETHGLTPAVDQLLYFANWITPTHEKRRFNARFFLTVLDSVVDYQHRQSITADGKETVQLDWFTPAEGLASWRAGKIVLIPPQWYALHTMQPILDHKYLHQAGLRGLRTQHGEVVTIQPQHQGVDPDSEWGRNDFHSFLAYPGDETYKDLETGLLTGRPGQHHRLYVKGRLEYFELVKNIDDVKANL